MLIVFGSCLSRIMSLNLQWQTAANLLYSQIFANILVWYFSDKYHGRSLTTQNWSPFRCAVFSLQTWNIHTLSAASRGQGWTRRRLLPKLSPWLIYLMIGKQDGHFPVQHLFWKLRRFKYYKESFTKPLLGVHMYCIVCLVLQYT